MRRYEVSLSFSYEAESAVNAVKQFMANIPIADWDVLVKDIATGALMTVDTENYTLYYDHQPDYPIIDEWWPSRRWNKDRTDYIDLSGHEEPEQHPEALLIEAYRIHLEIQHIGFVYTDDKRNVIAKFISQRYQRVLNTLELALCNSLRVSFPDTWAAVNLQHSLSMPIKENEL